MEWLGNILSVGHAAECGDHLLDFAAPSAAFTIPAASMPYFLNSS
jgi:hypothetical protein